MKKQVCAFITVLAIFIALPALLVSCGGGTKQLPDVYIDLEVTDFLTSEGIDRPYTYEVKHSYNNETHMDTVSITLKVEYGYGNGVYSGKCIYVYDRSVDTWECKKSALGNWIQGDNQFIEQYIEKNYTETQTMFTRYTDSNSWIGGTITYDGLFDITIKNVDFKNSKVTCDYYIMGKTTWGGEVVTANGEGTFDIIDGNKFYIPFENGRFKIRFSIYTGMDPYFTVEMN